MIDELKRKRGRPKEGSGKDHRIHIRVSEEFYNELKNLCEVEGESQTDYIIRSVNSRANLTRFKFENDTKSKSNSEDDFPEDYYMDEDYEDDDFYD